MGEHMGGSAREAAAKAFNKRKVGEDLTGYEEVKPQYENIFTAEQLGGSEDEPATKLDIDKIVRERALETGMTEMAVRELMAQEEIDRLNNKKN